MQQGSNPCDHQSIQRTRWRRGPLFLFKKKCIIGLISLQLAGEELIAKIRRTSDWKKAPILLYCGNLDPVRRLHKPKEFTVVTTNAMDVMRFCELNDKVKKWKSLPALPTVSSSASIEIVRKTDSTPPAVTPSTSNTQLSTTTTTTELPPPLPPKRVEPEDEIPGPKSNDTPKPAAPPNGAAAATPQQKEKPLPPPPPRPQETTPQAPSKDEAGPSPLPKSPGPTPAEPKNKPATPPRSQESGELPSRDGLGPVPLPKPAPTSSPTPVEVPPPSKNKPVPPPRGESPKAPPRSDLGPLPQPKQKTSARALPAPPGKTPSPPKAVPTPTPAATPAPTPDPLPPQKPPALPAVPREKHASAGGLTPPSPTPALPKRASTATLAEQIAIALYEWTPNPPEQEGCLQLKIGMQIVVKDTSGSGWYSLQSFCTNIEWPRWFGEFAGRSGRFPASYTALLKDAVRIFDSIGQT